MSSKQIVTVNFTDIPVETLLDIIYDLTDGKQWYDIRDETGESTERCIEIDKIAEHIRQQKQRDAYEKLIAARKESENK